MNSSIKSQGIFPMVITIFLLSAVIVLGIMGFRFAQQVIAEKETLLQNIANNKTTLLLSSINALGENIAANYPQKSLKTLSAYDQRVKNVFLLDQTGRVIQYLNPLPQSEAKAVTQTFHSPIINPTLTPVYENQSLSGVNATLIVPLNEIADDQPFAIGIDLNLRDFQQEILQEFSDPNYRVAVLDQNNQPVVWPFNPESLKNFQTSAKEYRNSNITYSVFQNSFSHPSWKVYCFSKQDQFETFRYLTIMFLVFALYCCLYQLMAELWGVNRAKTYFENIDFAIFNQINEGVIISNNAGLILFANDAAQKIFASRKNNLRQTKLSAILGPIDHLYQNKSSASTLTIKLDNKLLAVLHSSIVKKGKKLGSLTVINQTAKEESSCKNVLEKLVEIIPEGFIFLDTKHEVIIANLLAKLHLGNIEKGSSIDLIDPLLAKLVYENIDGKTAGQFFLPDNCLHGEMVSIYDHEIYTGTLIIFFFDEILSSQP